MKMIGNVSNVVRTVAKRAKDGTFEEKRSFQINARPASLLSSDHYGYGGMTFTLHGHELTDFGADLGDEVEIFCVRKGEDYANRAIEDVSRALYVAEGNLAKSDAALAASKIRSDDAMRRANEASAKAISLHQENIRLMTENETLKAIRGDLGTMTNLKQIGPA